MASTQAYDIACIELFSRLWQELEHAFATIECDALGVAEILRLEIHLLSEGCDCARWRLLLSESQQLSVRSTLQDVLLILDVHPADFPWEALGVAQNRLFDAVIRHCEMPSDSTQQKLRRAAS
jgi:hypothetical protein